MVEGGTKGALPERVLLPPGCCFRHFLMSCWASASFHTHLASGIHLLSTNLQL